MSELDRLKSIADSLESCLTQIRKAETELPIPCRYCLSKQIDHSNKLELFFKDGRPQFEMKGSESAVAAMISWLYDNQPQFKSLIQRSVSANNACNRSDYYPYNQSLKDTKI